jgi:4-amino-4-deoxy-L-arabinose transferase-like glycosyltransferase
MWIAILVGTVFVTQFGGFFDEVINGDESTFILMAASIVDGNLPYVEGFDNKPPLMFIMLAGIIAVFGKSLIAIRLFGDACILISSLAVFAIARRKIDTVSAGLGALISVLFSAAETGQFTSTELPATAMLMVALWILIARRDRIWSAALAGLLISLATLTRSNLGIVAIAFGIYFLWVALFETIRPGARWSLFAYILVGLIPPAILILVYASADALDLLKLAVIDVPRSYMGDQRHGLGAFLVDTYNRSGLGYPPSWFPGVTIALLFLTVLKPGIALCKRISAPHEPDREDALSWIMFGAIFYSMLIGGSFYGHYWIQIVPLVGLGLAHIIANSWHSRIRFGIACSFVAISFVAALSTTTRIAVKYLNDPAFPENAYELRAAADQIETVRRSDDTFWAVKRHLILWYLDASQISKAVTHPSNLQRPSIVKTLADAGYIAKDELQRIIDASPTFIILDGRRNNRYSKDKPEIREKMDRDYVLFHTSPSVTVFRLREESTVID